MRNQQFGLDLLTMATSPVNAFSGPCSDMPVNGNSRVHTEGRENYERSQVSGNWMSSTTNGHAAEPSRGPRVKGGAAEENAARNRGVMSESISGGYHNPPPQRNIHARAVKGEGAAIAAGNKGGGMKNLIENYGNLGIEPCPGPKVKGSEAEEYAEREKGSKYIMNHYSPNPIPGNEMPRPARLGLGGGDVAEKHKGNGMGPLMRLEGQKSHRDPKQGKLHMTSNCGGWDETPPASRMRPEGEGIAQKNSEDHMNEIMLQNTASPPQRSQSKMLNHMKESESPRNTPKQRVHHDGIRNMEKACNREDMSAIMHGSPSGGQPRPASGKKILPHLKRSELW